jgi:lipopolysaccharide transport system permease protein
MSETQTSSTASSYTVVIQPNQSWLRIDWRGLWEYRDLLYLMVRREFIGKYKQTILGPAWYILQTLLTAAMFTVIFARMAEIETDGVPHMLFYLCGLVPWQYFAQNVTLASQTFTLHSHLFEKVYFPRLIIPLSVVISNMMAMVLQFLTFLGFFLWFKFMTPEGATVGMNAWALLLPLLVLYTAAVSLGVSLWIASLSAKFRDFIHLLQFVIQIWMFATPVIYPMSKVMEKWPALTYVYALNPMSFVVECFRFSLLGTGTITPATAAISAVVTVMVFITGSLMFQRVQRTFVDIL